jgi:hypothetical protein
VSGRGAAAWAAGAMALSAVAAGAGVAVEGTDHVRAVPPQGAVVEPYHASGYSLTLSGDEARVEVEVWPLASSERFRMPAGNATDPIARLARAVAAGVDRRYDAVSRVLGWVSRNLRYELDRSLPQDAASVLERRSGYCTGVARLSVALLDALDIPAREVPGWVVGEKGGTGIAGYHRWLEVYYPDRGWVMSDPLATHHFVPANYLRLAAETVVGEGGGLLLEREDRVTPVDVFTPAGDGIRARRNDERQTLAALQLSVGDGAEGVAVLRGGGQEWTQTLVGGKAVFLGLEPGAYRLRVAAGGVEVERDVRFRGRVRAVLHIEAPARQEESVTR